MLDNFIFENHLGKRLVGLDNGIYLNQSELRNYSWDYDTINDRISRFYHKVKKRKIPLVVCCETDAKAVYIMNCLHELTEADIKDKLPGKIYVGEYYTKGYITESKKSNFLVSKRLCNIDLTLTSDDSSWYKEHLFVFPKGTQDTAYVSNNALDYPYDYKYDYAVSMVGKTISINSTGNNDFKLLIYGEAVDPWVTIGARTYKVNGTVGEGETLLIDSQNKTVILTTASGSKVNWFDKRSRSSYFFSPISSGKKAVTWSGTFGFDLTIIEKRSEPKWT